MASPPIPPLLGHLASRPFSFYPPILNIEHNEWIFLKATWSELVVVNQKTGVELSIPRHFVGEISLIDHPVVIVGLNRELEYKQGIISPYQRRVIEMPIAVGDPAPRRNAPAPVIAIRLESRRDNRPLKLIGGALAAAMLIHLGVANLMQVRQRAVLTKDRSYLDLTGRDDYNAVVRKLGLPVSERRASGADGVQYRALVYPAHRFTVVLMGSDQWTATYIGAMDSNWNPVHSTSLPTGGSTSGLLRALKKF